MRKVNYHSWYLSILYSKQSLREKSYLDWWVTGLPLMLTEYLSETVCYRWGYGELLTVTVSIHIPRRFKPFSQKSTQECVEFWQNRCKWSAHSQSLYTNTVTFTKDDRGNDRKLYSCALENQNDTNMNHLQYRFSVSMYVKLLTAYWPICVWTPINCREVLKICIKTACQNCCCLGFHHGDALTFFVRCLQQIMTRHSEVTVLSGVTFIPFGKSFFHEMKI